MKLLYDHRFSLDSIFERPRRLGQLNPMGGSGGLPREMSET